MGKFINQMKRYLFVVFFLLTYISGYSQRLKDESKKEESGFIQYDNQRYTEGRVRMFLLEQDRINLVIAPKKIDHSTPFELYINLEAGNGILPESFHSFDNQIKDSINTICRSFFVRIYQEWGNAHRTYQARRLNLYIQRFEENYLVSGWAELDTDDAERVEFLYYGPVKEEKIEVQRIMVYNPENYSNNQGNIHWGKEVISTPYAFQERKKDKRRICLINKLLYMDRALEYGVYFEFDSYGQLVSGEYKNDNEANPFKAAFFNQGKTQYPTNTKLTVKYNSRKKEYTLNYQMEFSDSQTLKGSYKGKIPQDDF